MYLLTIPTPQIHSLFFLLLSKNVEIHKYNLLRPFSVAWHVYDFRANHLELDNHLDAQPGNNDSPSQQSVVFLDHCVWVGPLEIFPLP